MENEQITNGPETCPQMAPMDFLLSKPYTGKRETGIISIQVQLPEPVAFPRSDGKDPVSSRQTFDVECHKDRAPEAFKALIDAPMGARIKIGGYFRSQNARVAGRDSTSWPRALGYLVADRAEVLQVLVNKSVADAANV